MTFTDLRKLRSEGRNFICDGCDPKIQKLRMCRQDRMDFTSADKSFFPIKMSKGGAGYGFCPGKATWDREATRLFHLMVTCYETKSLLFEGGLADQPGWFVELLGWFVSRYDEFKFYSRARSIIGDGGKGASNPRNPKR